MTQAIIGELSIETSDGTTLTAGSDLQLAWLWAEKEHETRQPGSWAAMSYGSKCASVADALAELRRAYNQG